MPKFWRETPHFSNHNFSSSGITSLLAILRTSLLNMAHFRITLMRSAIGLPKRTNGILTMLGLRRRMQTVFHPVSPDVAGAIMKVKDLVDVQEVEHALTKGQQKALRKPEPGYWVEKRVGH